MENALAQSAWLGEIAYCFPATSTQQAFWYLDRLERGNPAWNIAVRFELRGEVDRERLEAALNKVVARHESLRTTFELNDGEPMQAVHEDAFVPLPIDDLSGLPAEHRDVIEEELTSAEGEENFDLSAGPLIRARLLKLESARFMLLITVHHIVADGWSIGILSDEIASIYAGDRAPGELPLQFADYAVWHREYVEAESASSLAYWREQLSNLPVCEIPPDFARPATKSHQGHIVSRLLPEELTTRLSEVAREHSATLYVLALAALKLLVAHLSSQQDVYVGTQLAGRSRVEFEKIIGVFVNTAILRSKVAPAMTFTEYLKAVSRTFEDALTHGELPFSTVIASLHSKFDRSRHAGYGINFIYQRDFVEPRQFAGITMTPVPSKSPGAIYDLNFFMVRRASGWRLSCEYDSQLYTAETATAMLAQLQWILEQAADDPARKLGSFSFGPN